MHALGDGPIKLSGASPGGAKERISIQEKDSLYTHAGTHGYEDAMPQALSSHFIPSVEEAS